MLEISEHTNHEIGKYGHLHLDFIKKHRRGTYTTLLTEGRLNEHLHNIDEQAHEQIGLHISQMAERMGATEELKASDPMCWVQMMNGIKYELRGEQYHPMLEISDQTNYEIGK